MLTTYTYTPSLSAARDARAAAMGLGIEGISTPQLRELTAEYATQGATTIRYVWIP